MQLIWQRMRPHAAACLSIAGILTTLRTHECGRSTPHALSRLQFQRHSSDCLTVPAELNISRVKYIDDSTPRGEFFHTTPFFYKDKEFSFEKELRLVRPLLMDEQVLVGDEKDFGKLVPVDATRMLDRIVAIKNIPEPVLDYVRQLATKYCDNAEVLRSALEPQILHA